MPEDTGFPGIKPRNSIIQMEERWLYRTAEAWLVSKGPFVRIDLAELLVQFSQMVHEDLMRRIEVVRTAEYEAMLNQPVRPVVFSPSELSVNLNQPTKPDSI